MKQKRARLALVNDVPVDVAPKKPKKWPLACMTCNGDGDVPLMSSELDDDFQDEPVFYCHDCLGKGRCPRCAGKLPADWKEQLKEIDEEQLTCGHCNWQDGDDKVT